MKIAIVGEGPIGLFVVCALLTRIPLDSSSVITLTWYHKYQLYTRRHIVQVSQSMVNRISNELFQCNKCFNNGTPFDSSIRRLEYSVLDMIRGKVHCYDDPSQCYLKVRYEAFNHRNYSRYDHIFLANGFGCPERRILLHDNTPYKALNCKLFSPILVLYGKLGPVEITKDNQTSVVEEDQNSFKKILDEHTISTYGLELQEIVGIISIVYKTRRWGTEFTRICQKNDISLFLDQLNLWVTGFDNYRHFNTVFTQTFRFLSMFTYFLGTEEVIKVYKKNDSNSLNQDYEITLLNSLQNKLGVHEQVWRRYSEMVLAELTAINALDKRFLLHSVMPNCTCHGLLMDKGLMYATKKENTQIYLIGDSANSYPPGYSLEKGLEDVLIVIPAFCETYIDNNNSAHEQMNEINALINCKEQTTFDHLYEQCLENYLWKGGYPKNNDNSNSEARTFLQVIHSANLHPCKDRNLFITSYNIYMFTKFLDNIHSVLC